MDAPRPAEIGMSLNDVDTPCLLIDLDAFEHNLATMKQFVTAHGVRLRAHAKTHKSYDIAMAQINFGGACGICCQKVSEAEALVKAGVPDVLISNEVTSPKKIDKLAALAKKARVLVCVDDVANVDDLAEAAKRHGAILECLVEVDVGAGRCGISPGRDAVHLAENINRSPNLRFSGLQAYHGAAQHTYEYAERKAKIGAAISKTAMTIDLLRAAGLECDIVGGAGTGSYEMEGASGVFNELQCGSYIFMDADYRRVRNEAGQGLPQFQNSLFVYTGIMSKAVPGKAVCDAGLKALSADSGVPVIFGEADAVYAKFSDEHGVIGDPSDTLKINQKLKLIPGHCDPTVNLYDWYVCVRNGRVEALWPVTARGMVQ